MTAKTDLENAISILDAGITAHVGALKSARDAAKVAQSAANDDTFVTAMTSKVLALADTLNASNPAAVAVAEPVVAPAVISLVAPVTTIAAAPVAPVVTQPVVPAVVAPAATPVVASDALVEPPAMHDPGATPAMIAAWKAAHASVAQAAASAPKVGTTMLHDLEAALAKLTSKA